MTPQPAQPRPLLAAEQRPQDKQRRELTSKPNRSQAETLELILLQQRAIMEHLGIG